MSMNDSPVYAVADSKPRSLSSSSSKANANLKWKIITVVALLFSILSIALSIGFYVNPIQKRQGKMSNRNSITLTNGDDDVRSISSTSTTTTTSFAATTTSTTSTTTNPIARTTKNATVATATNSTTVNFSAIDSCRGLNYGGCLFAAYTENFSIDFGSASFICDNRLAEVANDSMYTAVANYVREQWFEANPASESVDMWLGSTFEAENNSLSVITLQDLTKARITMWAPGFPIFNSSYSRVGMRVNQNISSPDQGLFNLIVSGSLAIPLCSSLYD